MLLARADDVSNGTASTSAEPARLDVTKVTDLGAPTADVDPTLGDRLDAAYAEERRRFTLSRVRLVAALSFLVSGLMLPLTPVLLPERSGEWATIFGAVLLVSLAVVAVAHRPSAAPWGIAIAVGFLAMLVPPTLWVLSWSPDDLDVQVGTVILIMITTAFSYPWGGGAQAVIAGLYVVGYVLIAPWSTLATPRAITVAIVLTDAGLLSVVGAALIDEFRRDHFRRTGHLTLAITVKEEEHATAEALLDVARVLESHIDRPDLPECLNRLFTTHLGADWSILYAWDERRAAFCFTAQHGLPSAGREMAQSIEPSPEMFAPLGGLEPGHLVEVEDTAREGFAAARVMQRLGIASLICTPIARRERVTGLVLTGYRSRTGAFTSRHRRLALGIASGAAVALETAHLIADLQAASRLKSEFVATMSHELRTPLNVISGYTDLLADGTFGDVTAEQVDTLARVRKSTFELLDLVNATLDLSRLETGRETADVRPVAVGEVFAQLARELEAIVPAGVDLRWRDEVGSREICSDRGKLKTILKNLVGNALKFTPAGSVEVSARLVAEGLDLAVRDTGIGIAAEYLPVIFEQFRQVDGSDTRRFGGVGLGLHIVQRLVGLLGGAVSVESAVGVGSTFRVRLPVVSAEERATGT